MNQQEHRKRHGAIGEMKPFYYHPMETDLCCEDEKLLHKLINSIVKNITQKNIYLGCVLQDSLAEKSSLNQEFHQDLVIRRESEVYRSARNNAKWPGVTDMLDCDFVLSFNRNLPGMKRIQLEAENSKWNSHDPDVIEALTRNVIQGFENSATELPLYGLVLAGGHSTRMKKDKGQLNYHGIPQVQFAHELLRRHCEKVFVSKRQDQDDVGSFQIPRIDDRFVEMGPVSGILSAMIEHPEACWLVMACDLPFIGDSAIEMLINNRDPFKYATAFKNAESSFPEPLCTLYEPKSRMALLNLLSRGYDCPRKFLINSPVKSIEQADENWMKNVNDAVEFDEAKKIIAKSP